MALNIDELEKYVKRVNEILEKIEKESDLRHIFDVIRTEAKEVPKKFFERGLGEHGGGVYLAGWRGGIAGWGASL